jgi:hypothetical protein
MAKHENSLVFLRPHLESTQVFLSFLSFSSWPSFPSPLSPTTTSPSESRTPPDACPGSDLFSSARRLDDDVCNQNYAGNGTDDDPYIVDYLHNDRQDAMNFSKGRKWAIAVLQSLSTFAVTFASSVYVSGIEGIKQRFDVSGEVATLGLSLFVLGFALGPLIWAPLSEMYGRKSTYVISFTAYTAFSVAAACAPNITALLVLRFFASAFGSSSLTNTGGVIADMFSKAERGLATGLFVTAPFLGPALGRWWMSFFHAAVFATFAIVALVHLLILINFFFFRAHCRWFSWRDPGLALDSRFDRHTGRCGLDCHDADHPRNIRAVHSAMSSQGPLPDDRKRLCVPARCGKAAQDTLAGALGLFHAPLDPSVPRTHCLADVAVHLYRLWHTVHVLCWVSHRLPSFSRLEPGHRRTSVCRRRHWRPSCHAGGRRGQQTLRASVRGGRGRGRRSRARSQTEYGHGRLYCPSDWSVPVCVDDVSIGALDRTHYRRHVFLVWTCHGLHLADELPGRLLYVLILAS